MSDKDDIPMLNDLIERGAEVTMSDLGLDDYAEADPPLQVSDVIAAEAEAQAQENTELHSTPTMPRRSRRRLYARHTGHLGI